MPVHNDRTKNRSSWYWYVPWGGPTHFDIGRLVVGLGLLSSSIVLTTETQDMAYHFHLTRFFFKSKNHHPSIRINLNLWRKIRGKRPVSQSNCFKSKKNSESLTWFDSQCFSSSEDNWQYQQAYMRTIFLKTTGMMKAKNGEPAPTVVHCNVASFFREHLTRSTIFLWRDSQMNSLVHNVCGEP